MVERITVTVRPRDPVRLIQAQDAMRQAAEFFEMLSLATPRDEARAVVWRLVHASTNSPFTATAEAYPLEEGQDVADLAQRGKAQVEAGLKAVLAGRAPPPWVDETAATVMTRFLERGTGPIGRTDVQVNDNEAPIEVDRRHAKQGLDVLRQLADARKAMEPNLARTEYGSIEGNVIGAGRHYGRPAFQMRERLSAAEVWCVLTDEIAAQVGPDHAWEEVWKERRVMVTGEVVYGKIGSIQRVNVTELEDIDPQVPDLAALRDPGFTAGMSIPDYLDYVRGGRDA